MNDPDRLQHLNKLFYHDLGMCGCGNPEEAAKLIHDLLKLFATQEFGYTDDLHRLIGTTGAVQIVLGTLTEADLIEHGGTMWGSWLTGKGKWALWAFDRHGYEAVEGAGLPHQRGHLGLRRPVAQPGLLDGAGMTELLDTEFRGTFLAGRWQDRVLDSCRTFPPLSRQDQRTEFAGIFSDNDAPRSGHKVSGNIPRENGPRSRQRILRKILRHFLSRSRQENPGKISRKSRHAAFKTATGIRPEKSRRFPVKIRTPNFGRFSGELPVRILTGKAAKVVNRIGAPPPGPRRRNWIDHAATTARWCLLGAWLGPVIGGWA